MGLNVKNWTVRQRIQASFAVIIAIMLLMAAASFERLLKVEDGATRLLDDAMPGMFHITQVRSAWTDMFHQTIVQVSLREQHSLTDADKQLVKGASDKLDSSLVDYRATMRDDTERNALVAFEKTRELFLLQQAEVLDLYAQGRQAEARAELNGALTDTWNEGRTQLTAMIELNRDMAYASAGDIVSAVNRAELSMAVSVLLAIVAAFVCGYFLMQAITRPVQQVVDTLRVLASGDLTARLNLGRRDEFGAIETGFNGMAEEIKTLVAQAQRSSVQVTTSVTEIAATSKQQQATATETAATTTEIGATSREIAATSRDLVRTMTEVSGAAEQTSTLAGAGQLGLARMEDTMHQVMSAAELVNAKLAILN